MFTSYHIKMLIFASIIVAAPYICHILDQALETNRRNQSFFNGRKKRDTR